ncbi:glycosyltransferase [Neobacillus niacini]|uniref:glycosyltransferase n=1 Tax=Neobacillus niacini TaxID=86668 RepID=UPI0039836253
MELSSTIRYVQFNYPLFNWGLINTEVIGNVTDNDDLLHFCVIASRDYTIKVVALYESLRLNSSKFKLWVCCIDSLAYETLKKLNLEQMVLFYVEQFEDTTLRKLRKQRKQNEYCWTLKAPLVHYLLTTYQLQSILYCDGDLSFFSNPIEIFNEWGDASIYLCPQRDLDWVEEKYGKYQAGLIGFRNDENGLKSLNWWRKRCEEWCSAEPDNHRFGDQKYLDKFPALFSNIKISNHLGINAAPWNCIYNNNFNIQKQNQGILIEKDPLVAYHFACLSIFNPDEYDLWSLDSIKMSREHKKYIYQPYIERIRESIQVMKAKGIDMTSFYSTKDTIQAKTYYKYSNFRKKMDESDHFYCFATIMSKEYILKGLALYQSLVQQTAGSFHLWICSMDQESYQILTNLHLDHATVLHVEEVDGNILSTINHDRGLKECCWSMKAPFTQYILDQYKEIDHLIYCDADMYFFSSPQPIFDEWAKYSIFLTPQRSTELVENRYGIYQAGLIGFKQERNSQKILNWWKQRCLEWCYDSFDGHRWGDQKYLNSIPNLFSNIKIIKHEGINTAPWNVVMKEGQNITFKEGTVQINNHELVCYHFGSLRTVKDSKFDLWELEPLSFTDPILFNIYYPYLRTLKQLFTELKRKGLLKKTPTSFPYNSPDYTPQNPISFDDLEKAIQKQPDENMGKLI